MHRSLLPIDILASLQASVWTYNLFIISRLLVAGVLMFLFARLFLARLPAIMSAITFMLTGYFIVFLNMPHLSVEILTPGLFFTFELILRRNSWASVAGAAGMIVLGLVGGMPESIFLSLAAASLYFICRLIFVAEFRESAAPLLGKFVAAALFGFLLSAFLLFPFVELLRLGHDVHQPSNVGGDRAGLSTDGDFRGTIYYLLPLLFGPINNSIISDMSGWTGKRSYWGVVPAMLAAAAVLSLAFAGRRLETRSYRFLISFCFSLLVLMILKRFGSPVKNWIGLLPVSEMVLYTKYQEPIISFCVAMLAGIGFSLLIEKRAGWASLRRPRCLSQASIRRGLAILPQVLQVKNPRRTTICRCRRGRSLCLPLGDGGVVYGVTVVPGAAAAGLRVHRASLSGARRQLYRARFLYLWRASAGRPFALQRRAICRLPARPQRGASAGLCP